MLIIIEGVDKSGKSSLIEFLSKNLGNAYTLKIGYRPKDNSIVERQKIVDSYFKVLKTYKQNFKDSILILDRFYLSELVYSIKRGYDALDESLLGDDMRIIKEELENLDTLLIICRPDDATIAENFKKDKEDYAKIEEIKLLVDRYSKYAAQLKVKKLPFNYKITKYDTIKMAIKNIKW